MLNVPQKNGCEKRRLGSKPPNLMTTNISGYTVVISIILGPGVCYSIDKEPDSWAERRRAHHSLPQPLHFRVTFEDQEKRTASLRFEQVS